MLDKAKQIRKKMGRFFILFVTALIGVLVFTFIRARNSAVKVNVEKVEKRDLTKTISSSGETDVSDKHTVRALVGGVIKDLKYQSGDKVKKGDVIVTLDQASLKAAMDTAYSTFLSSSSERNSYDQKLISAKALESVRLRERDEAWRDYMGNNDENKKQAYKTAEYNYQSAVSALKTLQDSNPALQGAVSSSYSTYVSALNNYTNSVIKAPVDGSVALWNVYPGSLLTSGQKIFSIVNAEDIIFRAEIDEADVAHIRTGMLVRVSLDSDPGKYFDGKIASIDSKIATLTSGSTVAMSDITFDNYTGAPIVGLNGSADIELDKLEDVFCVSPDSILEDAEKKFVYVVSNGMAVKREVQTGFEGDLYTQIVSGLNENDLIVTNISSYKLSNGQQVKTL